MNTSVQPSQQDEQRAYYRARRPVTMLPLPTPYAVRHFQEAAMAVNLTVDDRVLELGAGMGRFAVQYAAAGNDVTTLELSADLASVCADALKPHPKARVLVGDALEPAPELHGAFDVVAGFFFLHHLPSLERCMAAVRACLRPGGRFVFVEPNPWNPLYYFQITLTPSMRWRDERGILDMRTNRIALAAESAGLRLEHTHYYGSIPRGLYDRLARGGRERAPEALVPKPMRPFVVFRGRIA